VKENTFPTTWCSRPQTSGSFTGLIDLLPTFASVGGIPNPQQYGFEGRDLTPILSDPKASVQDVVHFTYDDDAFPVKGANFIRAIVEQGWKYAVYYDAFRGEPIEYELYDLTRDPLEITNLAHPTHRTSASDAERPPAPAPLGRNARPWHRSGRDSLASGRRPGCARFAENTEPDSLT